MPGLRGNSTFRGYVPEQQRLISVLESDGPLPDDDPKTRGGGLDPSQQEDIGQISMYAQLRQTGSISDKAWRRLIQRNPKTSVLFGSIQTDPNVSTARARQEIGSKYFNPGQEAVPFETTEEQEFGLQPLRGNLAQEAVAPKADVQGAILESLNKGDIDFATKLGYGSGAKAESPFGKIDPKDYTPESLTKYSVSGNVSDLVPRGKPEDIDRRNDKTFTQESKLRDEFRNLSKDFLQVRDSFGRIQESAKNPSGAGDLALIFNYMKLLDPGSTVREGEFATAQNSAGVPSRVQAMYNKVLNGERLADDTRKDFVTRSKSLYERQRTTHKKLEKQYKALAGRYGVDGNRVVTDYELDELPETQTPQSSTLSETERARLLQLRSKQSAR